jgi:hypothetical protein
MRSKVLALQHHRLDLVVPGAIQETIGAWHRLAQPRLPHQAVRQGPAAEVGLEFPRRAPEVVLPGGAHLGAHGGQQLIGAAGAAQLGHIGLQHAHVGQQMQLGLGGDQGRGPSQRRLIALVHVLQQQRLHRVGHGVGGERDPGRVDDLTGHGRTLDAHGHMGPQLVARGRRGCGDRGGLHRRLGLTAEQQQGQQWGTGSQGASRAQGREALLRS